MSTQAISDEGCFAEFLESSGYKTCFPKYFSLDEWFPTERAQQIKSFAIGILAGFGAFVAMSAIFYVIQKHYPEFTISQDAIKIFNLFKDSHEILHVAWKALWRGFVVILGPVMEEVLFRGLLNRVIEKWQGEKQDTVKKVIRIALVALIFGACHLSPFQNALSNGVIFAVTTSLGALLMVLKETRKKDLITPIAAHIIFNLAATL